MRDILKLIIAFFALFAMHVVLAKNINLYDQPKNDAKVIGTIDTEAGIVPIFTPKEGGEWMKVGDPRNGNTGWVKSNELTPASGTSGFSITQHTINTGSGPQTIIQFGIPKISTEQTQAFLKQMEQRQEAVQKDMQKMMQDLFNNKQGLPNFPMIVPVIVTPQAATPQSAATQSTTNPTPPKTISVEPQAVTPTKK